MQDNNISLETKLRQAYKSIVEDGKSLRTVSEEIGIDRKKLKQLMAEILSPEELTKFYNALNKRNNRLKDGKNNKKAKALDEDSYKIAVAELAVRGIQPEWIESIYTRCQERNQTKISRDTLVMKLVELLEYFQGRNIGIPEESGAYISSEDVVQMILKNPRIINSDIKRNIIPKCSVITSKNDNDVMAANRKIKSNPGIFRKTIRNIREGR